MNNSAHCRLLRQCATAYLCIALEPKNILNQLLKYRYPLILGFFVLWMAFFDHNNMIEQYKLTHQKEKLEEEKKYYLEEIEKARKDFDELFTSQESLEKFAREKYLMKKDNEDIFVVIEEKD